MIFLESIAVITIYAGLSCVVFGGAAWLCDDIIQPYLWPEKPRVPPVNGDDDEFE